MAKLLDGDDSFNNVVRLDEAAKKKQEDKEEWQLVRETHVQALAAWKRLEEERKERNVETRRVYQDAVKEWEDEQDAVKSEGRRAGWTKPKQEKLESAITWPKKPEIADSDEEDDPDEVDEEDDD